MSYSFNFFIIFEARNAQVTFVENPENKIISFQKQNVNIHDLYLTRHDTLLKNYMFAIRVISSNPLCKSCLRLISTTTANYKNDNIFHIIDQMKVKRVGTVVNRALLSLPKDCLKVRIMSL